VMTSQRWPPSSHVPPVLPGAVTIRGVDLDERLHEGLGPCGGADNLLQRQVEAERFVK
jgi:hypothetical protein